MNNPTPATAVTEEQKAEWMALAEDGEVTAEDMRGLLADHDRISLSLLAAEDASRRWFDDAERQRGLREKAGRELLEARLLLGDTIGHNVLGESWKGRRDALLARTAPKADANG